MSDQQELPPIKTPAVALPREQIFDALQALLRQGALPDDQQRENPCYACAEDTSQCRSCPAKEAAK
jgi:hypothetical protein